MFQAPGNSHRSPEVLDEALVGVYRRGEDGHDVRKAVEETGEKVPAHVREVCEIRVFRVLVFGGPVEEVFVGAGVDEGDVHVAGVTGETLARFGHEAGGYAEFASGRFDNVSFWSFQLSSWEKGSLWEGRHGLPT